MRELYELYVAQCEGTDRHPSFLIFEKRGGNIGFKEGSTLAEILFSLNMT